MEFLDFHGLGVDVGKEETHPQRFLLHLIERGGPRQQQHFLGLLGLGNKDLLTIDEIPVAAPGGKGADLGRIRSRIRLGHGKRHMDIPPENGGEVFVLGRLGAVFDERLQPEDAQMNGRAGLRAAATLGHRLHDERGFGNAQTGPAVFSGDGNAQPASIGNGLVKIPGKFPALIPLPPVLIRKT